MVFIIIPVHNRSQLTRNCLLSLKTQTIQNFTTIVIDDGSSDGTSEMIQKEFPEVVLLHGDGNLWWTRAINLGVNYAINHGADYIMTLNDDTIPSNDFLEKMLFWAEKEPKALLGAFLLDAETNKPIYGGEIINWITANFKSLLDILGPEEWHGLHEVTHFPGRGLLIPAEVFRKTGLYNAKHFPQSAADYDLTHRAIRAGYKVFCNYDAKLLIYPDAGGDIQLMKNKDLKNYYQHLFGMKGGGNLKRFVFYALQNCPRHYLLFYFISGIIRRVFGYPLYWLMEGFRKSKL